VSDVRKGDGGVVEVTEDLATCGHRILQSNAELLTSRGLSRTIGPEIEADITAESTKW
jgi:hypothetical protein